MSENKLFAFFWFMAFGTVITLMALLWKQCDNQYERRENCINSGKVTAAECQMLFPSDGSEDRR